VRDSLDLERGSRRDVALIDLDEPVAVAWHEREPDVLLASRLGAGGLVGRAGRLGQLTLALLQRELLLRERVFALLDARAPQLDGAELAAAPRQVGLLLAEALLARGQLANQLRELRLAGVEIARPEPQEAFERGSRVAQEGLAALEVRDRVLECGRLRLELQPALGHLLLEPVLGWWAAAAAHDPPHAV
jgi:hypothetical protein